MESNQWFGSHNNAHQNQSQSGSYKNLVKPELRSNKNQFSTEIFLQDIKRGQALKQSTSKTTFYDISWKSLFPMLVPIIKSVKKTL